MRWKIEDTPEQAAFREKFLTWLSENLPDGWMKAIDEGDESGLREARSKWDVYRWQRTIGESGYAAPLWPKEYGGLSGEVWTQTIIREELSHYRLPLAGVNILGVGLAGPTLIEHGSEEQKQRYLRKILAADEIWCQLFSEPGAGSDLASLATRAVRQDGGWKVNGQKVWTSIAQFAHFGMLAARTNPDAPKHDGITYLILDMSSEGVEARPLRQMTGSSEFNEVYLTDVFVPDDNVIGEVDDGWKVCRTTLMNERVALAGLSVSPETFSGGMRRDPWLTFL
ncbi:MAG: acyl-CoA dehydrogenase family protein, partial [Actinomycetota bacterium]